MQNIQAVLFDVDGTLLDTSEFIFQAIEHATKVHKLPSKERNELAQYVGHDLSDLYKHLHGQEHVESLTKAHRDFQYANLHLSKPFPQTAETLKILKDRGMKLATVTTRGRKSALTTLKQANLYEFFDAFITGDDVEKFKPDPEPVLAALKLLDINKTHAVMVGDTSFDILAGKNAGVTTVGATYGFGSELKLLSPDFLIDSISELPALLI